MNTQDIVKGKLDKSKSGVMKGDRYQSNMKKKSGEVASSMEFDGSEGKAMNRSKSQVQKSVAFG